jgi:dCTP deaminase
MSIKSDKWIRRMCTPPEAIYISGAMHILVNRADADDKNRYGEAVEWVVRENGFPIKLFANDCIEMVDDEVRARFQPMIEPFLYQQVKEESHRLSVEDGYLKKVISYGTSSYGYDLRCSNKFKIFTNVNSTVIDPKNFDPKSFVDFEGDVCIIPPNSFALASSVEYFRIPRNILTVCLGKSTYARCGIVVNVTPFEPEWCGHVTLEFSNTTPLPAKIYANEGVAQVLFLQSDEVCETSYQDRAGKYMGQGSEPIPPRC